MKTVGDKLAPFAITGVKPGQPEDAFYTITEQSFEGKWKVIVYYPKDFSVGSGTSGIASRRGATNISSCCSIAALAMISPAIDPV